MKHCLRIGWFFDAGEFATPRAVIKAMVESVNPKLDKQYMMAL